MMDVKRGLLMVAMGISLGGLLAAGVASPVPIQTKGAPRLNVYFTTGFNDAAWQRAAYDKVAKAWVMAQPPAVGKKAVVNATIGRDGKVTASKITTESGSAAWDKAALEAVQKAAPFAALPKSWVPTTLEVHFHFEFGAA